MGLFMGSFLIRLVLDTLFLWRDNYLVLVQSMLQAYFNK
jgi:hypothetical protein